MVSKVGSRAKELCRGRWGWILPRVGVPQNYLRNRHGPCPMCDGTDRYRWDDRDGTGSYYCSKCGSGDGFMLAEKVTGKNFWELIKMVETTIGTAPMPVLPPPDDDAKSRARMRVVWENARAPERGGVVARYLERRVGRFWPSKAIREADGLRFGDDPMHPAMVAKIVTPDDQAANLHVTLLTEQGEKAPIEPNKRFMKGPLPAGSAIRLWPAAETMGVAEGIETAMAAAQMYRMPVWSVLNANMMRKWIAPEIAKKVFIFGDNDESFTGQAAAYDLAATLMRDDRELSVEVLIPELVGQDWADVLSLQGAP